MKRRILALLLVISLACAFALTGCGPKEPPQPDPDPNPVEEPLPPEGGGEEDPGTQPPAETSVVESYLAYYGWTVESLKEDFQTHPELVPEEGVLGGTMSLIPDSLQVMNTQWVYAEWSDGHIEVFALYEYLLDQDGKVLWRLLGHDNGGGFAAAELE